MIDTKDVYALTSLGKSELAAAGTSLSSSELALLVLIDGKATVGQVQASARNLSPSAVIEVLDRLLRSKHIALHEIELGDFFGTHAQPEEKGDIPNDGAIERGISTLRQQGYIVRIARRPPFEPKIEPHRKLTVVVVEDDQNLAEKVRTALTLTDFLVRIARNREQVVAAFRQPPLPDLVLLDVTLPDTDGFTVLGKMRQHPMLGMVPVIMVTGAASREAVMIGLLGGANGYITKPFEIEVLVKAVRSVLGIQAGGQAAGSDVLWKDDEPGARVDAPTTTPAAPPDTARVAPVRPVVPAGEPEAYAASPGSLLAQLKAAAQAKRLAEQKPGTEEQMIPRVSAAVEKVYRHLKALAERLKQEQPAYAKEYIITGGPKFDGLKWAEVSADFRTRELSPTTKVFEQATFIYRLSGNKTLSMIREIPADDKLKQTLLETKIAFTTLQERNARGTIVGTKFVIPCEVNASLRLVGNFDTGKLLLKTRNVEHFGTTEYVLASEAITDESLVELSRLILGEARRIGPLLLKSA